MRDTGSPSSILYSDGGSPSSLSTPLSSSSVVPSPDSAQDLQPLIDYITLSNRYADLCSALGVNKRALLALNQIIRHLSQGQQPRNEDVNDLLVRDNCRSKHYGCAFQGCDRYGRGLGDRPDKAREHVLVKHLCKVYVCSQCFATASRANEMKVHIRQLHSPNPKQFQCQSCSHIFTKKSNLHRHMKNTHGLAVPRRVRQS
ncbi:hypothetical protein PIIN_02888 [Serendipita indica DSM 11827]|uniref:C2H2-type domain-containing protein n=1 Tax=Serendipita indica (strain DSM 11827) TaxID=1109443 RepID=G4TCH7_SERID|nr:hypothetical protein PIIN_02888 [Serendipita indica DSM 11827]